MFSTCNPPPQNRKGMDTLMNYADIKQYDVANGPGVRVSLFVSGCTHHCKNCFNQEAWDFGYGQPFTAATTEKILDWLSPGYVAGLSLLGGEPFERSNQQGLLPLLRKVREAYPEKNIWCWSGFLFDKDIMETMYPKWPETKELLSYLDVLVDGKFIEEQKSANLIFRGSANQRSILVPESIREHQLLLWTPPE